MGSSDTIAGKEAETHMTDADTACSTSADIKTHVLLAHTEPVAEVDRNTPSADNFGTASGAPHPEVPIVAHQ
eukprot:6460560-Amphidinium_carterae.1